MTDDEHAARIARIRAERVAAGRQPTIQSPVVYRLLAACLDATTNHNDRAATETN